MPNDTKQQPFDTKQQPFIGRVDAGMDSKVILVQHLENLYNNPSQASEQGTGTVQPWHTSRSICGLLPLSHCQRYVSRGAVELELRNLILGENQPVIAGIGGMGGTGKTELARHLAQEYLERRPGCVVWITVSENSPRQVEESIARQLGCTFTHDDTSSERKLSLRAALERAAPLVIFDDVRSKFLPEFEQCLPPCPPCSLLVTSRCRDIPALPPGAMRPLDCMTREEALDLLRGVPGLSEHLAKEPAAALDLCAQCVCHPLALTLAARRLLCRLNDSSTPIAAFVECLKKRLVELRLNSSSDQSSVEANLELSYADLDTLDQRYFRSLSVFDHTGFGLSAAAALWGTSQSEARDVLERFQNLSLVLNASVPGRFRLHDLLLELATLHAGKAGELDAWQRLHCKYLVDAFEAHPAVDFDSASELFHELSNLSRAAAWASDAGEPVLLALLATKAKEWLSITYVAWEQWETWLQKALDLGVQSPRLKAEVLGALGSVQWWLNKSERAEESHFKAFEIFRQLRVLSNEAVELESLGSLQEEKDDLPAAEKSYTEALGLARDAELPLMRAKLLLKIGTIQQTLGAKEEAKNSFLESLSVYDVMKFPLGEATVREALGDFYKGDAPDLAEQHYMKALAIFQESQAHQPAGHAACALGDLQRDGGHLDLAERSYLQARDHYRLAASGLSKVNPNVLQDLRLVAKELGSTDCIPCQRCFLMYRDVIVPFSLATMLQRLGEVQHRRKEFESAAETLMESARYRMAIAEFKLDRGYSPALLSPSLGDSRFPVIAEVHGRVPSEGDVYRLRGCMYLELKDYSSALEDFNHSLGLVPEVGEGYGLRGVTRYRMNDYVAAVQDFSEAIRRQATCEYYVARGRAYFDMKDYSAALRDFNKAVDDEPEEGDNYCLRGQTYCAMRDYPSALHDLAEAIRLQPDDGDNYRLRGIIHSEAGNYTAAVEDLTHAIQCQPDNDDNYTWRGRLYRDMKDYGAAERDFTQAMQRRPDAAYNYFFRGIVRLELENYTGAIEDFTLATQYQSDCADGYYFMRGCTYLRMKDYRAALEDFTQAIQRKPNSGNYYRWRGIAHSRMSNYLAAIRDFMTYCFSVFPRPHRHA